MSPFSYKCKQEQDLNGKRRPWMTIQRERRIYIRTYKKKGEREVLTLRNKPSAPRVQHDVMWSPFLGVKNVRERTKTHFVMLDIEMLSQWIRYHMHWLQYYSLLHQGEYFVFVCHGIRRIFPRRSWWRCKNRLCPFRQFLVCMMSRAFRILDWEFLCSARQGHSFW